MRPASSPSSALSSIAASRFSLAGDPLDNLTVIVGTRWLDATVSGPTVDAGLIGEKPVGTARQYSLATADYRFAGTGISIDATVEHITSQVANSANTIEVPARAVFHIGGRYRFKVFGKPATLRLQVQQRFRQVRLAGAEQRRVRLQRAAPVHAYTSPRTCRSLNFQRRGRIKDTRGGRGHTWISPCIAHPRPLQSAPSVAGWSSLAARRAHNPKVVGSNPTPATTLLRREKARFPGPFSLQQPGNSEDFRGLQGCRTVAAQTAPTARKGREKKWAARAHFLFPLFCWAGGGNRGRR